MRMSQKENPEIFTTVVDKRGRIYVPRKVLRSIGAKQGMKPKFEMIGRKVILRFIWPRKRKGDKSIRKSKRIKEKGISDDPELEKYLLDIQSGKIKPKFLKPVEKAEDLLKRKKERL